MNIKRTETEFKKYLDKFTKDPELTKILNTVTYQQLFNDQFLQEFSKWQNLDELVYKGDFGIMNLEEHENVNPEAWNAYVAKYTECETWHQFGKLAMLHWMRAQYKNWKKTKK